ncbi:MAG: chemotaxis protein CheC [Oscillospiraceae bacterium]|nr:chemotaxis protein CheC [Oscillospiraceae bacterium]MBR5261927.1 chemotaxis protein CheC [Oscillospiraceae bacterium]
MANISGTMDAMQLDILREIANIGAGHASSALSMMMEMPVEQRVPDVMLVRLEDLNDVLGGAERPVVGVSVSISGDIQGFLLMVLDIEQAKQVVEAIRYQPVETENGELFSFIDRSALKETLNIMAGSYLTAISELTGLSGVPSTPDLALDMLGSVLSMPLALAGESSDFVLYFRSGLFGGKREDPSVFSGDLLLVPDRNSYAALLESLGCG